MESSTQLIQPLVGLVVWSFVMWGWMYATRIPAVIQMKIKFDPELPNGSQTALLPSNARWKADNFNHLMEQPTLFYALILALVMLNDTSTSTLYAAWAYLFFRIVHSLVQAIGNNIMQRFYVYVVSNIALIFLTFKAASAAF